MVEKILIVEDEFIVANDLSLILKRAGYDLCGIADSVEDAREIINRERPSLVLLDILLKGKLTGIDLARQLKEQDIAFIYLSANSNKELFLAAKATDPDGFLIKPFREKDILVTMDIARYHHENSVGTRLRRESLAHTGSINIPGAFPKDVFEQGAGVNRDSGCPDIIGQNEGFLETLHKLKIVAPLDTTVLILGEDGTGKERIAGCIHHFSRRKDMPFIKVNCRSKDARSIDQELFGDEKDALAGENAGKFEQANGGTIFLNEVGETTLALQAKILRVLQEKEIEQTGGKATRKLDVRVIAATNKNLEDEVAKSRFRIDLYYRLNAFPLLLPPLRDRRDDIPLLLDYFNGNLSMKKGKTMKGFSKKALDEIMHYDWPGNIRELEQFVEHYILYAKGETIEEVQLPYNGHAVPS